MPQAAAFDVTAHAYAHRGLWDGRRIPENSLAAFHAARTQGVGVELDVRLTRDGSPVVFHDATLERMCGRKVALADIEITDPRDALLPNGFPIPTLNEALDAMGDQPVLIELKVDDEGDTWIADIVAEAIKGRPGKVAVMSFDEDTVAHLRNIVRDRPIGLLIDAAERIGADAVRRKTQWANVIGCAYVAPHITSLAAAARAIPALPRVTWTIRDPGQLQMARQFAAAPIFEHISANVALTSVNPI